MPAKETRLVLSSSGGADAEGRPVITPLSVLRCVDDANGIEFQTLAVDTVRITVNALWCAHWTNVALPVSRLFSHVPVAPALIRHWLHHQPSSPSASDDGQQKQLGGLVFPVNHMCMTSKVPRLHIEKSARSASTNLPSPPSSSPPDTLRVDLDLQVFRRDLSATSIDDETLPPFDPALWQADSYERWHYMHATLPSMLEDELGVHGGRDGSPPSYAAALFRRMMRAHSDDAAIVFGQMWWSFGLHDLAEESLHVFMRRMLMGMFSAYYAGPTTPPLPALLPPCFDAVTVDPAQRMCAACLLSMLGSGRMLRCPCHKVYYCSKACQLADWEVHRVLCPVAAARTAARAAARSGAV